jgi:hypothetical protein
VLAAEAILEVFSSGFYGMFGRLVTVDEIWIHISYMIQRHSGSQRSKKFMTHKSSSKVLESVCWDKDGILAEDNQQKGASVTENYCVALLDKLKQQLVSKR